MKKKLLTRLMMLWTFCMSIAFVQAQTDVTNLYLTNAGFDEEPVTFLKDTDSKNPNAVRIGETGWVYTIAGWTNESIIGNNAVQIASAEYGVTSASGEGLNGTTPPTADKNGGVTGASLHMSAGWGDDAIITQAVNLAEGRYELSYEVYNGNSSNNAIAVNFCGYTGSSTTYGSLSSVTYQTWTSETVSFTVTQNNEEGKISLGFTTSTGSSGAGAKLYIDNVKLLYYGIDKTELESKIAEATTLYGDGSGNAAANLQIAFDAAQAVADNESATVANVSEATQNLQQAIYDYKRANDSNLMSGWDAYGATNKSPYDMGWRTTDTNTLTWASSATINNNWYQYRDNLTYRADDGGGAVGRVFIHPKNTNIFSYPVVLEAGKLYEFSCRSAKMSGADSPRSSTFAINTAADGTGTVLGSDNAGAAKWDKFSTHSFSFISPAAGTYYLTWQTGTDDGDRSLAWDFSLTEIPQPTVIISENAFSFHADKLSNTFTVYGVNLNADITLSAPAGITLSAETIPVVSGIAAQTEIILTWDGTEDTSGTISILSGTDISETITFATYKPTIANWAGRGVTGEKSQPNHVGWSNDLADWWQVANSNVAGVRFRDNIAPVSNGRYLMIRGDEGTKGSTFFYPLALEGGKRYKFTMDYFNGNYSGSDALLVGIYTAPNTTDVAGNKNFAIAAVNTIVSDELNFGIETTGIYYLGFACPDGWVGITNLQLTESLESFTVTFNSNGGSDVPAQNLLSGEKATQPADPVKEGFEFGGWYSDEDVTTLYDFDTPVTANITIYAKWSNSTLVNEAVERNFRVLSAPNGLNIVSAESLTLRVLSITGQLVKAVEAPAGTTFVQLPAGMYIINNVKALVK